MKLYLGTNEPTWLGRSPAPLFVSLTRADRFRRRPARAAWALDSGGFTQVVSHGGWRMSPDEYLSAVYALADRMTLLEWAAPQDYMCEPAALAATGLTIDDHQRLTVENFCVLREIDERRLIIPVLQGFAPGEHERCVELYEDAGVRLLDQALIGVGSICRRQATAEIEQIVRGLAGVGFRLHGFGIKIGGLRRYADALISADSMAWSYRARRAARHGEGALGTGCTHRACTNCYVWAQQWHALVVAGVTP